MLVEDRAWHYPNCGKWSSRGADAEQKGEMAEEAL